MMILKRIDDEPRYDRQSSAIDEQHVAYVRDLVPNNCRVRIREIIVVKMLTDRLGLRCFSSRYKKVELFPKSITCSSGRIDAFSRRVVLKAPYLLYVAPCDIFPLP